MDTHLKEVKNRRKNERGRLERGWSRAYFADLLRVRRRWVAGGALLGMLAMGVNFLFPSYQGVVTLTFEDPDSSPLQGATKVQAPSNPLGKSSEPNDRAFDTMKTQEFRIALARDLRSDPQAVGVISALLRKDPGWGGKILGWMNWISYNRPLSRSEDENEESRLADALKDVMRPKKVASTIELIVTTRDPELSVETANRIGDHAVTVLRRDLLFAVEDSRRHLEKMIVAATDRLREIDQEFVQFKIKNQILSAETFRAEVSTTLSALEKDLVESRIVYRQNQALIKTLSGELDSEDSRIAAGGARAYQSSDVGERLRAKLEALKYKKGLLQAENAADTDWEMKELNLEISRISAILKSEAPVSGHSPSRLNAQAVSKRINELKKTNQDLVSKIETVKTLIAEKRRDFTYLPEGEQVVLGLKKRAEIEYVVYQDLTRQLVNVQNQEVIARQSVRVTDRASLPALGRRLGLAPQLVIGLLMGAFVGFLFALLRDDAAGTVRRRGEFLWSGATVVASIPHIDTGWFGAAKDLFRAGDPRLFDFARSCDEDASEGIALWQWIRNADPRGTIAVVSASRGDGKTFLCSNLAWALARKGKKVLLIDCDYGKGTMTRFLRPGEAPASGPGKAITRGQYLEQARKFIHPLGERLDFIPARGFVRSRLELLNGGKFRKLLRAMESYYDVIIVDTPGLDQSSDALVVAAEADRVFMAVSYLTTPSQALASAIRKLSKAGLRAQPEAVYNRVNLTEEYAEVAPQWRETDRASGDKEKAS